MSQPSQTTKSVGRNTLGATFSSRRYLTGILGPLKQRNFCLLVSGQMISTMGDLFYAVALPWFLLTNGLGIQALSIVLTAYGISRVICLPLGGILSDRLHPRRVMLLSDIMRAILMGVLAGLVLQGHPPLWELCLVTILSGCFAGLFLPASFAILPELLPDQDLQAGNALNLGAVQFATFFGPILGGLVVNLFSPSLAFALDAISFVISAMTLFSISGSLSVPKAVVSRGDIEGAQLSPDSVEEEEHKGRQTFWQFAKSTRLLQVSLLIIAMLNVGFGGMMEIALPLLAKGPLRGGVAGFGLLLSAYGLGALLGSIGAGGLSHIRRRCVPALLLTLVQAIGFAIIPLSGQITESALILVIAGVANGLTNVLFFTLVQQQVPRYLLGSILSAFLLASLGLYPLSAILGGFIATHFGPLVMFPLTLFLTLPALIFGLTQRELWKL